MNKYYEGWKGGAHMLKAQEDKAGVRADGGGKWRDSFTQNFCHYLGCLTDENSLDESWSPVSPSNCRQTSEIQQQQSQNDEYKVFSFKGSLDTQ